MKSILFIAATAALLFTSCKKEKITGDPGTLTGNMIIELDPKWNTEAFVPGKTYINQFGEDFTPSLFKYYVSNIVLTAKDGSTWSQPNSYHIIDHKNGANELVLKNIFAGDYTSVSFTIGVDSVRNVSGAQEGALDPANQMFWSWNTGYIFFKLEGKSSASADSTVSYHTGGFTGANNALRTVTLSLETAGIATEINPDETPEVHVFVDAAKVFYGASDIKISEMSSNHMPGAKAAKLADNYRGMFKVDHVH
ncbi:MAG: MbnP family protein [Bacteroidota bacterium]